MKVKRRCCVPTCGETNDRQFSFFRFPESEKNTQKWLGAIGLPHDIQVGTETFVCVKHFVEKDIAQRANRKIGQKARLKYGSIPRLFLEPIKKEVDEKRSELLNLKLLEPIGKHIIKMSDCSRFVPVKPKISRSTTHKCSQCNTAYITANHLFSHIKNQHFNTQERLKISELLKNVPPLEIIYSSESECEYEISVSIKRIPIISKLNNKFMWHELSNNEQLKRKKCLDQNVTNLMDPQSGFELNINNEQDVENCLENTVSLCVNDVNSPILDKKLNHVVKNDVADSCHKDLEEMLTPALIRKPVKLYDRNPLVKNKILDRLFKKRKFSSECNFSASDIITDIDYLNASNVKSSSKSNEKKSYGHEMYESNKDTTVSTILQNDSDEEAEDGHIRACYECKMCKDMFLSFTKMKKHLHDAHCWDNHEVTQFYKTYPYKNIRPVNGLRAYACSVCLMMYYNIQSLKKHQIITHGDLLGLGEAGVNSHPQNNNINVCHVCQKSFLDPENLRSHLLLHVDYRSSEVSVYKCDRCKLGFEYEAALKKHIIESHAKYACAFCCCSFTTTTGFHEHMKNHTIKNDTQIPVTITDQLELACPESHCEFVFKEPKLYYSHILYDHKKIYQDDQKFIKYLDTLNPNRNDSISFTNENLKFSCELCNRRFTHYSFLKAHEFGKNNIRYECPSCDIKSCSKLCLIRHFNVYHDSKCEKLYFCGECPKALIRKSELLLHMNEHRPKSQRIFHCLLDGCDRVFADEETYKYHIIRLHTDATDKPSKAGIVNNGSLTADIEPKICMQQSFTSPSFEPQVIDVCNEVTICTDLQ